MNCSKSSTSPLLKSTSGHALFVKFKPVKFATIGLSQLAIAALLTPWLLPLAPALAQYKPPQRPSPIRTDGTGSRGCEKTPTVPLTLLVPNNHDGWTVAARPTLAWYMPEARTVEIALTEPGVPKPLLIKQLDAQPGIAQVTLPADAPELVPGRTYRWSLAMICNPKRRSADVFAQAWIKRVDASADLTRQLAGTKSDRDRSRVFAQNGLWYDALAAIATAHTTHPKDTSVRDELLTLLEQGGLTRVVTKERQQSQNRASSESSVSTGSPRRIPGDGR